MGSFWSQPLRWECPDLIQLITCRTINSALWFLNNKPLEDRILAYLAKYVEKHQVELYGFVFLGNHYHMLARFPKGNRAVFFKNFNARVAESVRFNVPEFRGGPLFDRRYTPQPLPTDYDVLHYFKYCALQPVSAGLTERISEYPGYNSFSDAILGRAKTYKLFNFGKYNAAKRYNPNVKIQDFVDNHILRYKKLPEFESLSRNDYSRLLFNEIEQNRLELVKSRKEAGKSFVGVQILRRVKAGSFPHNTKKGGIRPLVLSFCKEAKAQYLNLYFAIVEDYRKAVEKYFAGDFNVEFPPGTYRPPGLHVTIT
jgi:REP element-mobilizing transposase RayT